MIIIPEIKTVVILVPRTGSGSLRRSIAATYPRSMQIYRHMEADGVPAGYDMWPKVGVVRHPLSRLWSLYKFMNQFGTGHDPAYIAEMRASVAMPFDDWIVDNKTVFTSPYDSAGHGRYWPHYSVRHPLPENRKSQFLYLRPDLGTRIFQFGTGEIQKHIGVPDDVFVNQTPMCGLPHLSDRAKEHVRRFFAWDLKAVGAADGDAWGVAA